MGEEETSTEAMASFILTLPCSFLQFLAKACSCCLGLSDSFKDPNDSTTTPQQDGINGKQSNDPNGSSQEQENGKTDPTGASDSIESMAARRRPRAKPQDQGKPPQHNTITS